MNNSLLVLSPSVFVAAVLFLVIVALVALYDAWRQRQDDDEVIWRPKVLRHVVVGIFFTATCAVVVFFIPAVPKLLGPASAEYGMLIALCASATALAAYFAMLFGDLFHDWKTPPKGILAHVIRTAEFLIFSTNVLAICMAAGAGIIAVEPGNTNVAYGLVLVVIVPVLTLVWLVAHSCFDLLIKPVLEGAGEISGHAWRLVRNYSRRRNRRSTGLRPNGACK